MNLNCEYCSTNFKSKSALKNHKNNARYCLEIQRDIEKVNTIKCSLCNKL